VGYYLLDHPNPYGDHFYSSRRLPVTAITMHITAGLEDLDAVDDHSCEGVTQYAATTSREVSWHGGSDTDSSIELLPPWYTAWHASDYNSSTYGWEISKTHTDWTKMSELWVERTLRRAAQGLAPIVRDYKIPIRKASRAEVDRARLTGIPAGFISHAELQPADRTDPGWVRGNDTFPWGRFFTLLTAYLNGDNPEVEIDEMGFDFNQVTLPATGETETLEREVIFPDFGGAMGVIDRWVKIHGPGQPFTDSTQVARKKGQVDISHFLDDAGNIVGTYAADDVQLTHHKTLPSVQVPTNASKLVLRYHSVAEVNVAVYSKTA
jgi:hypothetical protein